MDSIPLITTEYFRDKSIPAGLSKNIYRRASNKHKWDCVHICMNDNRVFAFQLFHELKNIPDNWQLGYCIEPYDGSYPKKSHYPITRIYIKPNDTDIINAIGRFITTGIVGINPKILNAFMELGLLNK